MTGALLYLSGEARGRVWQRAFGRALPDLAFLTSVDDIADPSDVRYLAAWTVPEDIPERFPNLEVVISIGAGVDQLGLDRLPPELCVVRMVTPGIRSMMVDYVSMGVLVLHRGLPAYLERQRRGAWERDPVPLARRRSVGVMGLGNLGRAVLETLAPFGFRLRGWARNRHRLHNVETFAGDGELAAFLAGTDILICLLPLTPETEGLLSEDVFAALPRGAGLVHAGRGRQLDTDALMDALDAGHLSGAVLDVVHPEPLPGDSPLWSHPKVILTPHVATETDDEEGAEAAIAAIRAHEAGLPVPGQVDRARSY